ncbi:oleate hydratase, partial [Salmonella enterica]
SALKFTKYNQYESLIKPLIKYLEDHDVKFQYNTTVDNIIVEQTGEQKQAVKIELTIDGNQQSLDLTPDDLVFITNGSITE